MSKMVDKYEPLPEESSADSPRTAQNGDGIYHYEDFIGKLKYGKFFFAHLFVCSLAASADSIEIMSLSMILPSATCDLLLTSVLKGWIDAAVFIGMMFGGALWGSLADVSGRKTIMLTSLTVNWVAALISSFVTNRYAFLILRFFSGLGIGGSIPVIFAFFIEFQHKNRRGTMGCIVTVAWMMGNVFQAGMAWAIIPNKIGISTALLDYTGWRMFIAICAIPSFLAVLLFTVMPESPRYLLQEGRDEEAIVVLKKIYRWNNNEEIEINKVILVSGESSSLVKQDKNEGKSKFCAIFHQISELFSKRFRWLSINMIFVIGLFAFGYYGLFMWFPELFNRMGNGSGSVCSFNSNQNATVTASVRISGLDGCNGPTDQVYLQAVISMSATAVGPLLPLLFIDKIGRKPFFVGGLFCTACSLFFFYFITNMVEAFVLSSVFAFLSAIVFTIFDISALELYPTHIRSTAFGIFCSSIRLASILANVSFGMLIDQNCSAIIITPVVFLFVAGVLSSFIPDMTSKEIS